MKRGQNSSITALMSGFCPPGESVTVSPELLRPVVDVGGIAAGRDQISDVAHLQLRVDGIALGDATLQAAFQRFYLAFLQAPRFEPYSIKSGQGFGTSRSLQIF
jgi:hypothetical protein